MQHERDLFDRITAARTRRPRGHRRGGGRGRRGRADPGRRRTPRGDGAVPDLKANQNVLALQEELVTTENRVGFARQLYNDLVARYNTRQQVFPANLVASALGFMPAEFFQVDAVDRELPRVDLGPRCGMAGEDSAPSAAPLDGAPAAGGGEHLRRAAPQPARHVAPDRGLRRAARLHRLRLRPLHPRRGRHGPSRRGRRFPCPSRPPARRSSGSGTAWLGYRFGDRAVLASSFARPVEAEDASAERQAAHERGRGDGDRRGPADAAGLSSSTSPIRTRSPPAVTRPTRRSRSRRAFSRR